jgi:hypothetical protein
VSYYTQERVLTILFSCSPWRAVCNPMRVCNISGARVTQNREKKLMPRLGVNTQTANLSMTHTSRRALCARPAAKTQPRAPCSKASSRAFINKLFFPLCAAAANRDVHSFSQHELWRETTNFSRRLGDAWHVKKSQISTLAAGKCMQISPASKGGKFWF